MGRVDMRAMGIPSSDIMRGTYGVRAIIFSTSTHITQDYVARARIYKGMHLRFMGNTSSGLLRIMFKFPFSHGVFMFIRHKKKKKKRFTNLTRRLLQIYIPKK